MCKLFKIIQIWKDRFWILRGKLLRFLSAMLYMTTNFHANISVWKTFPKVQSTKKKLNFSLTWRQRVLMNSYHRRSSLKKFFPCHRSCYWLVSYVSSFVFFIIWLFFFLVPFLPSSFLVLLLPSKFVFFSTVTDSFLCCKIKTKFKYLMRCWKGNGQKGVDLKFLLQRVLCLCDWQLVTIFFLFFLSF